MTIEATPSIEIPVPPVPSRLLLRDIRKRWDKRKPPILDDLNLELEPGAVLSLIGENGVGKTTLLRIVAGLIFPDGGEVHLDGFDPRRNRREYHKRIGFLSAASGGLYARMSLHQHLAFAARLAFIPGSEHGRLCAEAIDRFGLAEFASRRVDRLSMGQRQRVRLAMTFVHRPQLILLDEPWNSLDEAGARILSERLRAFRDAGGMTICCTPTGAELAAELPNDMRVVRLKTGKLHPA